MEKENIIIGAASKVHEDWCMQEYKGFWERAKKIYDNGEKNFGTALNKACYKGETKRNELFIDIPYMVMHEAKANNILNDFSIFMSFVNSGALDIKRFTKRELTEEEQIINIRTNNYKKETAEENILRDFKYLSASSKKENLEAAVSAYSVFEQFSKAGISIEEMKTNAEIRNLIGVAIHTDWLKRNPNHENEDLKVAYSNLDEWTKSQDLTVFDALVSVAQQNNVVINKEDGFNLPDYLLEEQMILENIRNKKM